jgi:MFS family permease
MVRTITPIGWMAGKADGTMVPTYPAGVPMHQALLGQWFGWSRAPFLVGPVIGFLTLFVFVALMTEFGLPMEYAMGGAAIYVLIPAFVNHATQPVSDSVAGFYSILAIWLALRASRVAPAILPAILSGVVFSIGVWVRPTNFLLCIALAFALRWNPRRLIAAAIGAAPLGLALAWWNKTLYGGATRTGYGSFSEVIKVYPACGAFHLRMTFEMLTPLVALGALLVFVDRRVPGWLRALIGVWMGSFLVFYSFYDFCDERFLLPALPALIAGFLLVVKRAAAVIAAYAPRYAQVVAGLVIVAVIGLQIVGLSDQSTLEEARYDRIYPTSIAFAEARLPKDAVVVSGLMAGAFLYDTNRYTFRFDVLPEPGRLALARQAVKRAHKKWYALLSVYETTPERFAVWEPSRWVPVGSNGDVTLWKLEE